MQFFQKYKPLIRSGCLSAFCSFVVVLGVAALLGGCTSSIASVENTKLPELTFDHIMPVQVPVAAIHVENNYEVGADSRDVSSSFPTPPDIVLRRYAEHRLASSGGSGTLKFIIEAAHVYHRYIEPEGIIRKWMRTGGKDRYDVSMRFRMYKVFPNGSESRHSVLTVERYMAIPESTSLARREREQLAFLELLMQDIDEAVTRSLQDTLKLAALDGDTKQF